MSSQITTAFVKQFSDQLFHLSQQKGSRLRDKVRNESQRGKSAFYDRLGPTEARDVTTRHGDTVFTDTPHSRRRVTLKDSDVADAIDQEDKLRMLIDPTSAYAMSFIWALGRKMDDRIIDAAGGSAYGGEEGGTEITLPNTQKIASVDGGSGSRLNVEALRRAKKKLDENEVHEDIPRYFAASAEQMESLLSETEVTSSDFNTVKALVEGMVDTFLGFKFVRTQRLNVQSGALSFNETTGAVGSGSGDADTYEQCFAWAEDGILLAIAKDMVARIGERPDKRYLTQVYACMSIGSTRMEEEKVVQVLCAPNA